MSRQVEGRGFPGRPKPVSSTAYAVLEGLRCRSMPPDGARFLIWVAALVSDVLRDYLLGADRG